MNTETDVLIIGGGILGCSAAYYLAREGVEVVLVERDDLNTQASGRNAGSLHVQLQSMFMRTESEANIRAREKTLPLFMEGVRTWKQLAQELDSDIELTVHGGLMVAETEEHMQFIRSKSERERRCGIEVSILGKSEVRAMAPYLSERIIGAEFCPHEGKLNPTLAIPALAHAAERTGARILRHVELMNIAPVAGGFVATTSRGAIRCRRVVNAAGAFATRIAAMAGFNLPITFKCIQGTVSEPTAPVVKHLVYHAERILTFKQATSGNLIIGGGWPAMLDPVTNHPTVIRSSIESNMWVAMVIMPEVAHLRLLRAWAGVNLRTDGMPVLGEVPGLKGFYNIIPADAGLSLGPVCARLVAELMCGRKPSFDIGRYSIERFSQAPAPA